MTADEFSKHAFQKNYKHPKYFHKEIKTHKSFLLLIAEH